jgi:hypothetical protein
MIAFKRPAYETALCQSFSSLYWIKQAAFDGRLASVLQQPPKMTAKKLKKRKKMFSFQAFCAFLRQGFSLYTAIGAVSGG